MSLILLRVRCCLLEFSLKKASGENESTQKHIHAGGATGDLATLLEAINIPPPIGLGFTLHVVIVVRAAAVSNEKRGTHQRSRRSTDFLDLGNAIGHRRRVDQIVLIEPGAEQNN